MKQTARFHEGPHGEAHARDETLRSVHDLNILAKRLGLSREVSQRAGTILSEAARMRFAVVRRPVLAAASLYVACREHKVPVTLRDLAEATGTEPREVGRCYMAMLERMHITRPYLNGNRYLNRLTLGRALSEETYKVSEEMISRATEAGLGGRNPMTLAAAALYLACCSMGEKVTQAQVAEAAGVGEESVRECCKAIRAYEHVA
jgi:transcription initiation factor TFIIB